MRRTASRPGTVGILLPTVAVLQIFLLGCDLLDESGPERTRLVVSGESEVQVVVSTDFAATRSETAGSEVELVEADTFQIAPPFDSAYSISARERFFAETSRLEGTAPSEVRMQVFVDGESRYDQTRVLDDVVLRFAFSTTP
ncbi:MAG: hypothetical protein ACOC9H_02715 [Gemmatimonadota bacterium]